MNGASRAWNGGALMTPRDAASEALARMEAAVIAQESAAASTGGIVNGVWQSITGTGDLSDSIAARAESARALFLALTAKFEGATSDAEYAEILEIAGRHANTADLYDAVRLTQPAPVIGSAIAAAPATIVQGAQRTIASVAGAISPVSWIIIAGVLAVGILFMWRKAQ